VNEIPITTIKVALENRNREEGAVSHHFGSSKALKAAY
jgi:hypothetical protein